jgi:hypothetical protein
MNAINYVVWFTQIGFFGMGRCAKYSPRGTRFPEQLTNPHSGS